MVANGNHKIVQYNCIQLQGAAMRSQSSHGQKRDFEKTAVAWNEIHTVVKTSGLVTGTPSFRIGKTPIMTEGATMF